MPGMTRDDADGPRLIGRLFFALLITLAPSIGRAEAPIDVRLRQVNRLLAQYPYVDEVIGAKSSVLSVEGRFLVLEVRTPDWRGAEFSIRGVAPVLDLDPAVYDEIRPTLPCRKEPPHRSGRFDGCWRHLWTSDGGRYPTSAKQTNVEHESAGAAFIIAAIKDLIVMLKAREDALR